MSARALRKLNGRDSLADLEKYIKKESSESEISDTDSHNSSDNETTNAKLGHSSCNESGDDSDEKPPSRAKPNLFALLGNDSDSEEESEEVLSEDEMKVLIPTPKPVAKISGKGKKGNSNANSKKPKGKKGSVSEPNSKNSSKFNSRANTPIAQLSLKGGKCKAVTPEYVHALKLDSRNLDPEREIRQLFGRVSREDETPRASTYNLGRGTNAQRAKTILHSWGGKDGKTIPGTTRKLQMTRIKPEWIPSLSKDMSVKETWCLEEGCTAFYFDHSQEYRDAQRRFYRASRDGDPQNLMNLTGRSPYHPSTLLQVSEILVHGGQSAEAADMVERSLFAFDRALLSKNNFSFDGKCRLPFRYYSNRLMFLTVYRHVCNLARRGTWLTALEYVKLLLSLDGEDPYYASLMIDYFSLKAGEFIYFVNLASTRMYAQKWADYPNISYSLALGLLLDNKPDQAAKALHKAITKFPWVAVRIAEDAGCHALLNNLEHNNIVTAEQNVYMELFMMRSGQVWKSKEAAKTLFVQVVSGMKVITSSKALGSLDINRALARHIFLTNEPKILGLLPSKYTNSPLREDDILPPLHLLASAVEDVNKNDKEANVDWYASMRDYTENEVISSVNPDTDRIRNLMARMRDMMNPGGSANEGEVADQGHDIGGMDPEILRLQMEEFGMNSEDDNSFHEDDFVDYTDSENSHIMVVVSFPTDQFVDRLNVRATESHERGASRTTERAASDASEEDVSASQERENGDSESIGPDNIEEDHSNTDPSLVSNELMLTPPTLCSPVSTSLSLPVQVTSSGKDPSKAKADSLVNKTIALDVNHSIEDPSLGITIDKALLEINSGFSTTSTASKSSYNFPTGYKPSLVAHNGLNSSGVNANSYLYLTQSSKSNKPTDNKILPVSLSSSSSSVSTSTSSPSSSSALTAAANAANQFYSALAEESVKADSVNGITSTLSATTSADAAAFASAALPGYIKRKKRRISSREAQGTPVNPDAILSTNPQASLNNNLGMATSVIANPANTINPATNASSSIVISNSESGISQPSFSLNFGVPIPTNTLPTREHLHDSSRESRDLLSVYDETKFCRECNLMFDTRLLLRSHRSYYHSFKVSTTIKVLGNIPGTSIGDQVTAKRDEDGRFPCPVVECTFKTKNRKTWCGHIRKVPHAPNPQLPGTSIVNSANQFSVHNMNQTNTTNTEEDSVVKSKTDIKDDSYMAADTSEGGQLSLMCEKCDKHLSSPWMVDSHMANYHSRTASVTLKATSSVPGAVEGDVVTTVRTEDGFLECPIEGCSFRAKNKDTWRNHVARKPHMGGAKAPRFKPLSEQDVREHIGNVHVGNDDLEGSVYFKCKKCDLVVDSEARLENHMDFLHGKRVSVRLKESSKIPGKAAGDIIRTERTSDGLLFCPIFDCQFQTRHRATWCSHVQSAQHL
ncbi:DUF654-domain-containing protein [Nadsonia fulvescens var. elongata DSM 6958]|uniref:DUF654-domain-containing protein n=1 Tax=Nadsonia fulvescens var. elongata DSM 6958 TaxID=857566 RepID=A0A1E3PRQ5_9ASCO|nr:DUF654-domain-containing protein [Nadsonia fulvescens var. elongata DSM 6958]